MQIEWLPGGCIEDGELVLDSLLEKADDADDEELQRLYDEKPQKFIFNFVREYGNLEYVNIGRVIGSLSRRPAFYGRRGVYVAVLKQRESDREIVSIIRMQKYGVREYLEEGRSLLDAMLRSEEYTEYILDRRLGLPAARHESARARHGEENQRTLRLARRAGFRRSGRPISSAITSAASPPTRCRPAASRTRNSPCNSPGCSGGPPRRTSSSADATWAAIRCSTTATKC